MSAGTEPSTTPERGEGRTEDRSVLTSSAVMAAGTVVSRLSGFVRSGLLLAALGNGLQAEVFQIANTVPNMLYILLAGGVFNAVLVPQLVRAMTNDEDGGVAYTGRIITAALLFLGVVTVVLVVFAPVITSLVTSARWPDPAQDSVVALARYCLPQVFFYGAFVLIGQVLNARGSFGPMMWAPIANNVISVGVLAGYLALYGGSGAPASDGGYTTTQELVLGIGSTLGIVAQLVVLTPAIRHAGISLRPRFALRGTGLGHTLRLGTWTVLFVLANQVAYFVVTRLGSSGPADGSPDGTGMTIYATSYLVVMVPHSVITVSLATAILPRLSRSAAEGDLRALSHRLAATMRTALAVLVPFAALLPLVATDVARLISYGKASETYTNFVPTLSLFGVAIVLFTVHYLVLRGFYALERTRTVFLIQVWVALTNIVVGIVLVHATSDAHTAPALVVAYGAAYLVGSVLSYGVLARSLGGLEGPALVRFAVRTLLAVAVAGLVARGVHLLVATVVSDDPSYAGAAVRLLLVAGADVVAYLVMARLLRLREVGDVLALLTRRRAGAGAA